MTVDAIVLTSPKDEHSEQGAAAGGSFVAYSTTAPDKTTDNEDTVAVIPVTDDVAVLVIADGAGGLPGGRWASLTVVEALQESLRQIGADTGQLRTAILNGLESANETVMARGNGSATTATVVSIDGLVARSYQVGDSEAIVVGQRGRIRAQTTAHSPTGFAVEAGLLDQRDALHHEERHLVSNFIGTADMRIEMGSGLTLQPRDTVLLASDGLVDNVHLHEIADLIRKGPIDDAARALTSLARRRMTVETLHQPSKPDDLSVILFRKPYTRARQASASLAN
jgi:serine/threonine protein phosphatase PrpC